MSDGLNNNAELAPSDLAPNKRLDEIKRRRAEIAAARERRAEERARAAAVEDAERELADDEALEKAEIEIGPVDVMIALVDTPLGQIIMKRPHAATFKRFQDRENKKSEYVLEFIKPCRVYPDLAAFERILEALPATAIRCANAAARLAGVRNNEVSEK
jgi:hypothetical protein